MNDIKVTIIIPVYNPGEEIINSLNSATCQNLKDMEIICVNDGSSDNSIEILRSYQKRDSRIKIINQENAGAGIARNNAIKQSKGKYILFLDSDDWIEENTCELLFNYAEKQSSDLVLFNCLIHRNEDRLNKLNFLDEEYENKIFNYENIQDKIFNGPLGVIWNKFYKTSFLKENNIIFPNYKLFNDVEFHIKSMTLAKRIAYLNNTFYHYNNITHFSLQQSYVGTGDSVVFYDVMCDVRDFLDSNNLMSDCRNNFLNFSFFEFKIKLENIDSNFKAEYFLKIKKFFETMKVTMNDFKNLKFEYFLFYIFITNSNNYSEFETMNNKLNQYFDENDNLNEFDNESCNEAFLKILENKDLKNDFAELTNKFTN